MSYLRWPALTFGQTVLTISQLVHTTIRYLHKPLQIPATTGPQLEIDETLPSSATKVGADLFIYLLKGVKYNNTGENSLPTAQQNNTNNIVQFFRL